MLGERTDQRGLFEADHLNPIQPAEKVETACLLSTCNHIE